MDFLKNIALPQPIEHFHLLVFAAALSSIVVLPYTGFVLGSSAVSLWLDRRGSRESNRMFLNFGQMLVDDALYSKSLVGFLGIIPGLTIVLLYAEMLQSTPAISVGLAGFGFLFLLTGMALLYSYKYTFRLRGILDSHELRSANYDIDQYRHLNLQSHLRSGKYGLVFLLAGFFLYTAALSITIDSTRWSDTESVFDVLLLQNVWFKFIEFLALAVGVTGVRILYLISGTNNQGKLAPDDNALARSIALRFSATSLLALPLLVLINVAVLPGESLSGLTYGLPGAAIALLFFAAHFLYGYSKTLAKTAASLTFFGFISATVFIIAGDHVAIGNATQQQAAVLAAQSDKILEEVKQKIGVTLAIMTGEDIYNAKCSACHQFEVKKVGPPYNVVLKKYLDRKAEMVAFVLNPVKVDPAYPPMPNQGLRSAEADSIVTYLLNRISATAKTKDSVGAKPNAEHIR